MSELAYDAGKAADLGYILGQNREKKALSIDHVATAIHLRKSHIRAMEKGALSELPGDPYTRSYIKRYAQFLGLDADDILRQYDDAILLVTRRLFELPEIFRHETHASGMLAIVSTVFAMLFVVGWNMVNPAIKVPLIMPFEAMEVHQGDGLPHRCSGQVGLYPPCSWERIDLWYQPVKPPHHVFAVDSNNKNN